MIQPDTRYATVGGGGRVAYPLLGDGPRDLVHTMGLWSQVDVILDDPSVLRYLNRLASFSRVLLFDPRGTGLSDPRPADGRSLAEHWTEDLIAVLDTIGGCAPAGLVELRGDGRLGGLAVHIGARVMALAGPGEVLVSHTVHGILIGSRYVFEERAHHQLKGVPGTWPLYAVGRGGVPT